jgi:DNA topoisomerase I
VATAVPLWPLDPAESARVGGLRYVNPSALAGLRRLRHKRGFVYVDARGRRVRNRSTIERIRSLVIPPAWKAVWICPDADGHLQAVGRDARGRKQYRYHSRWRQVRDATKFHKMGAFARALSRIRASCARDLARPGLSREKVVAAAVRLLDLTHVRIGNAEYTRENGSYGLTTLRDRHVHVSGGSVHFKFRGKSGKMLAVGVHDRHLARVIARCSELPGHELFQYIGDDGAARTIHSGDVNDYLRDVAGEEFTAKDFRTWAGTVLAAKALRACHEDTAAGPKKAASRRKLRKNVVDCIKAVAAHLGNTPAVCKRCYVHPGVIDAYLDGTLGKIRARDDEALARALLRGGH